VTALTWQGCHSGVKTSESKEAYRNHVLCFFANLSRAERWNGWGLKCHEEDLPANPAI